MEAIVWGVPERESADRCCPAVWGGRAERGRQANDARESWRRKVFVPAGLRPSAKDESLAQHVVEDFLVDVDRQRRIAGDGHGDGV